MRFCCNVCLIRIYRSSQNTFLFHILILCLSINNFFLRRNGLTYSWLAYCFARQVAMETAFTTPVSVRAAHRCPGPVGVGRPTLAPEQQEHSAGTGWTAHSGLLPPLLQCWWWGREGALVRHQGFTEQVKLFNKLSFLFVYIFVCGCYSFASFWNI